MKFRRSLIFIATLLLVLSVGNAANDFYSHTSGAPATGSQGSSATMRAEFDAVVTGFDKLPTMTANGNLPIFVNAGGTALSATSASSARSLLGLTIGTNVQAYDATLQSISALGTAANKMAYTTGVDTWAEASITAAGLAILDDADNTAQRTTLGLGSIATVNSPVPVANGGTASTTASAARTALGLAIGTDVEAYHGYASQAEAEAGTENTKIMTALRTSQAIAIQGIPAGSRVGGTRLEYTATTSTAATIPHDDTIPQDGEGFQVLTGTYTPTKAGNLIRVRAVFTWSDNATNDQVIAAIFQSGSADALAADMGNSEATQSNSQIYMEGEFNTISTAIITFKMFIGGSGATIYLNGINTGRLLGGKRKCYIVIDEFEV